MKSLITIKQHTDITTRYSEIFKNRHALSFVGQGWLEIIENTLKMIYPIMISQYYKCFKCQKRDFNHPMLRPKIIDDVVCKTFEPAAAQVQQIKEKLGLLKIYVDQIDDFKKNSEVIAAISAAESQSAITCEDCGGVGKQMTINGWISTVCDSCQFIRQVDREGWTIVVYYEDGN
jgi:hypothetical protein